MSAAPESLEKLLEILVTFVTVGCIQGYSHGPACPPKSLKKLLEILVTLVTFVTVIYQGSTRVLPGPHPFYHSTILPNGVLCET